jgi:hypothetical protein
LVAPHGRKPIISRHEIAGRRAMTRFGYAVPVFSFRNKQTALP